MSAQPAYRLHSEPIAETDEFAEVLEGLRRQNKRIEPRFFYDERGSELFTEITRQPEYYPTRTEMSLLQYLAADLRNLAGEGCTLIEYGSGSSEKIRILLESLKPAIYAPLDISKDYLVQAADNIGREYPWLDVQAICVDYTKSFDLPAQFGAPSGEQATGKKLGFFPGSSIGNFSPEAALAFLQLIRQQLGNGGALLIGVDLKKSTEVLNQAYNDAAGITAEFNLNMLKHLNSRFKGDFDVSQFRHIAFYDQTEGCIRMYLESECDQTVTLRGEKIAFVAGERVHTENSYKYSHDEFSALAENAGFCVRQYWRDSMDWFGVFYLEASGN